MKPAVLNASPLIILARAGYLDLLGKLVSPVVIPRAVAMEINAGPPEDPAVRFLAQPSWFSVVDLTPALSPSAMEGSCSTAVPRSSGLTPTACGSSMIGAMGPSPSLLACLTTL